MRTWVVEAVFVAFVMAAVVLSTGGKPVEWVGALAVLLTFCFTQVGTRLAEAEDRRTMDISVQAERVHCHRWLTRYLVLKEACWLAYFVWLGAWSALVGVGVFLLYPVWRRFHVARRRPGP